MTRIFISHSHSDEAITYKLVNFLLAALGLQEKDILCTSNPDQGLSYSSSSITDQLKEQLKNSEALIVLITADSLHSAWIPFEAGSFWTTDKPIIPILGPGLTQNDLPGPLKSFLSIPIEVQDAEDKLNNATNQLAKSLNLQQEVTKRRNYTLQEFCDALRAWQSKRPVSDQSQQKEIQELKAQIDELRAVSQKEKEELEQNYQNQKQQLEQSLQFQIRELEQQLKQVRSLNKQLEDSERAYKEQLEELEAISRREKEKLAQVSTPDLLEEKQPSVIEPMIPHPGVELKDFGFEVVTVDSKGEEIKRERGRAQYFTEELDNRVTLDMIAIPGGKFMMGSPEGEGTNIEKPQHEVTVPFFYMGKYPVTQAQYTIVMREHPSQFYDDDRRPVEKISWLKAIDFCNKLSAQTGKEYRLPSEAEWEYACRAETITAYHFGENITTELVNFNKYAGQTSKYVGKTTSVGKYKPNSFGLYDMHGNVFEWCLDDWYNSYLEAPSDGSAWISTRSNGLKVLRGGSWFHSSSFCRSAYRQSGKKDAFANSIGFRVVCVAS